MSHTLNLTLPDRLRQHLPGQLLKILSSVIRQNSRCCQKWRLNLAWRVNILHGKIEYIGERALGILVVQLTAPHNPSAVDVAVEHIRQRTAYRWR